MTVPPGTVFRYQEDESTSEIYVVLSDPFRKCSGFFVLVMWQNGTVGRLGCDLVGDEYDTELR